MGGQRKAWGAYLAARLRSDDLNERFIEQLRSATALRDLPSHTEEHAFLDVLFDALIEADITVPGALLEPFEDKWTDPVLILLARNKDNEDLLLKLREQTLRDIVWLAVNNLLSRGESQRWFAAALREISITHRFTVTDFGNGPGFGSGGGVGSCRCCVIAMPKGFPPVTLCSLQDGSNRGGVLLAEGPQNVSYKRTIVPTDRQVGFGSCSTSLDRMAIRLGYLAQLRLASVEETERLFHAETHVRYTSIDAFEREGDRSMKAQEQGIRELIRAMEKRWLGAPNVRLRIVPELIDNRQRATDPLPIVAPREINLPQ